MSIARLVYCYVQTCSAFIHATVPRNVESRERRACIVIISRRKVCTRTYNWTEIDNFVRFFRTFPICSENDKNITLIGLFLYTGWWFKHTHPVFNLVASVIHLDCNCHVQFRKTIDLHFCEKHYVLLFIIYLCQLFFFFFSSILK